MTAAPEYIGDNDETHRRFPLWYHPIYTDGIHPKARFPRERYEMLLDLLRESGAFDKIQIKEPNIIEEQSLLLAHDRSYVRRFLEGTLDEKEKKRIGLTPWTPAMVNRTLHLMGGALEATEHAHRCGGISGNMAGGTHHAHRAFGSGYCVFNDLAVCALHALEYLGLEHVAVLDLDVHQGDGTATILADEPRATTLSVHCSTNFPFRKSISDHDFPVPPDSGDDVYLAHVKQALEVCLSTQPSMVFYQAGVDGLESDALGKLRVTRAAMRARNNLVFEAMHQHRIPVVVFMGGGYAKPIERSLEAFLDLFVDAAKWNARW